MNEKSSSQPNSIPIRFGTPENKKDPIGNAKQRNSGADTSRKPRILVVEDEALVAENIKEFLESSGYRVIDVAYSGEEALKKMSRERVDLILMDVRLAGKMDGIETALLIHQTRDEIPVVFLTAYAEELFPKIYNISPLLFRFISKPYDGRHLNKAIQDLLRK
jgi:CheY-like chemotaxis protein